MVILNGHRPTSDDVSAEVARSFRNIMAGAAEAMEAVADRRPIDADVVEDHLDAELLRAQEVLHPEDFAGGKSLREVLDATS